MNPVLPPDLTIVLLGKSGVGKSASGNTILGQPVFNSRLSFKPVTTEISEQTENVFRKQITVVDTPGILDTKNTEKEIKKYCQGLLDDKPSKPAVLHKNALDKFPTHKLSTHKLSTHKLSTHKLSTHKLSTHKLSTHKLSNKRTRYKSSKTKEVHVEDTDYLFLVVIRVGLLTEEDQKAVTAAIRVLKDLKMMEKSYLLFTGGDMLEGMTLKDLISEDKEEGKILDYVLKLGGRYHLFNNKDDDKEQVRELLQKSGHLPTQDQPDPPGTVRSNSYIDLKLNVIDTSVSADIRICDLTEARQTQAFSFLFNNHQVKFRDERLMDSVFISESRMNPHSWKMIDVSVYMSYYWLSAHEKQNV